MPTLEIETGLQDLFSVLKWQPRCQGVWEVLAAPHRFKNLCAGRRFGKSETATIWTINKAFKTKRLGADPGRVWNISPVYSQADIMFERILYYIMKDLRPWFISKSLVDRDIIIQTGKEGPYPIRTQIGCRSADKPNNLRGWGLDGAVIEEADYVEGAVIKNIIRPALADRQGEMFAITTPNEHPNDPWFEDWFDEGLQDNPLVKSWRFTTMQGGIVPPAEIEVMRQEMTQDSFQREIMAEFVRSTGSVFKNVQACIRGEFNKPKSGKPYIVAADLARYQDFTAIGVLDYYSRQLVHLTRMREIDWNQQMDQIKRICHTFNNAPCIIDSSGAGDPIVEQLVRDAQVKVIPYKITSISKEPLIRGLQMAIEQESIGYPNHEILLKELKQYAFEKTPSGLLTTNAPQSKHDDCVIMLALLWWGYRHYQVPRHSNILRINHA